MTEQELILFVRKKLKAGYPAGELKSELLRQGYTEGEIEAAVKKSAKHQSAVRTAAPSGWMLAGACCTITGLAFIGLGKGPAWWLVIIGAGCFVYEYVRRSF